MSWKFNPPPGWPAQPEGWVPPPGWVPDPSWPPPPAGWQFWVPAGSETASPPASAAPPSAPPPAAAPPPPAAGGTSPFSSTPAPPFSSTPAPPFSATGPGAPSAPPYGAAPRSRKPWFGRWWGILVLIAMLLVGAAAGYGATRAALNASDDSNTNAAGNLDPAASESPLPQTAPESPALGLPSLPPLETPAGAVSELCSEVAVIMLTMALAPIEETDDADAYIDTLIDSRRTAADEVRELEGEDADQQASVEALADEIDGAAQMVEDDRDNYDTVEASFDRVTEAYDAFNNEHCI
jgi:hypothetical protein